ncbi:uncharacterized protein ACRADG_002367 isoform 2-T2 [Cochliomyia hominivorax]
MKLDNLSKHGILTGIVIIIFLLVMTKLAANNVYEIAYLTELLNDFTELEPPPMDIPIAIMASSVILILVTALMIFGIIKESQLFIAPWLIIFIIGLISESIFFLYQLMRNYQFDFILYILCVFGIQILILSPIAWIFQGIRYKKKAQCFDSNVQKEIGLKWSKN